MSAFGAPPDTLDELAEDANRLVFEHERADLLGTERPSLDDLRELAAGIDGLAMSEDDEEEFAAAFEGLRWPKMSQAERRRVLVWLRTHATKSLDNEHSMGIDAAVEVLQRVCETEGVV